MNIYCASSWRNPWQPGVVWLLRSLDHQVYDFREPAPGVSGFSWREVDPDWQRWSPESYREGLKHPVAEAGFRRDMEALRACDACVLVLPCGSSAHLELGFACGQGKRTAVLFPVGMPLTPIGGHTCSTEYCGECEDDNDPARGFLGCLLQGRLDHIEPELMPKMAGAILIGESELKEWVSR